MKVLGISGTPRVNGNSDILLQHALKPFESAAWEIKLLRLSKLKVNPCDGCETCKGTGKCAIQDDMQLFYDAIEWCDAIIISSPVYSRYIASPLMCVLDRTYAISTRRPLEGKVGGAIAVGRGTSGGQTITLMAIYNFMLSCGIICVPGEMNGVTAVASEPGDILKQENRLHQAKILGENILKTTLKLRQ